MTTWTVAGRTFHLRWWPDMAWRIAVAALALLVIAGSVVALIRADLDGDQSDGASRTAQSSGFASTTIARGPAAFGDDAAPGAGAGSVAGGATNDLAEEQKVGDLQST